MAGDVGFAAQIHPIEAAFLYMPFEHAENPAMQERGVAGLEALAAAAPLGFQEIVAGFADYARRHREVIRRFGRFPHRNSILDRAMTSAEQRYLDEGGYAG